MVRFEDVLEVGYVFEFYQVHGVDVLVFGFHFYDLFNCGNLVFDFFFYFINVVVRGKSFEDGHCVFSFGKGEGVGWYFAFLQKGDEGLVIIYTGCFNTDVFSQVFQCVGLSTYSFNPHGHLASVFPVVLDVYWFCLGFSGLLGIVFGCWGVRFVDPILV
uniref:Uncharacterized protein n=1 Tax=Cacopsylla melanoneura TaxID=428564 RepID=A0A8D8TU64_9HEMI